MSHSVKFYAPTKGRLMIRETGGNAFALVGVLHFPPAFDVKESASYVLMFIGDRIEVVDSVIDEGLPEEAVGNGIAYAFQRPCWRTTRAAGTMTVRFFQAWPETNGWVVFGPSALPLIPALFFDRSHAWLDVAEGCFCSYKAPFDATGEGIASTLNAHAVWPDVHGDPFAVPTMESEWRPVYLRQSQLYARLGAGEITMEEFRETIRVDAQLFQIRSLSPDMEYARYLVRLRECGGLVQAGVRSAAELEQANVLAAAVIREVMSTSRSAA